MISSEKKTDISTTPLTNITFFSQPSLSTFARDVNSNVLSNKPHVSLVQPHWLQIDSLVHEHTPTAVLTALNDVFAGCDVIGQVAVLNDVDDRDAGRGGRFLLSEFAAAFTDVRCS